jgi:serine/threonine protein kinase
MQLTSGTRLGPYEIIAPLGAGGMGEVYRARDTRLGRDVAVKVLPQHLSANPEVRARFEREAKTISSLNHPNICTLFDVGLAPGEVPSRGSRCRPTRGGQIADALDRAHYLSDESGRQEAYVQSYPVPGGKYQVTTGGTKWVGWPRDGKRLVYGAELRPVSRAPLPGAGKR